MRKRSVTIGLSLLLGPVLALGPGAYAKSSPAGANAASTTASTQADSEGKPEADKLSTTEHQITIDGQVIKYTATAGTIVLKGDDEKPRAKFFFISYSKDHASSAQRPVTFVFNGGPGSSSVWLHLGAAGPKRVSLDAQGFPGAPPYRLVDNPQSWLDTTDLVFIDPIGTGYSRPAEGFKTEDFWGVQKDIESVGDFIRMYLTRYHRWDSPKFLAGESYGTTRAAGLSAHLMDRYGISLNGIVLISTVLNFQTLIASDGNELPYALYLPSYTSIALFHHKIETADRDKLLNEVSSFAMGDYLAALAQGGSLSKDGRAAIADRLSKYTGLPADLIDRADLRISPDLFRKHLLNDQRLLLGRYDARMTGEDPNPAGDDVSYDPAFTRYLPVYSAAFNQYIYHDLKYESDLNYEILTAGPSPWDFGTPGGAAGLGFLDLSGALRSAMLENPNMKVLVASGQDDLATPFLGSIYTMNHLDLSDVLHANVTQTYYQSGHMIYHDPESLKKLKSDVRAFMLNATGGTAATEPDDSGPASTEPAAQ